MKRYQVIGDLSAEKSSEAYPFLTLCDECVEKYEVITTEITDSYICDDCEGEQDTDNLN